MELWKIVVPAVTAILLWLLAKWNDDRKKKADRRAVPYDQRIREAREYVDTKNAILLEMGAFYRAAKEPREIFFDHLAIMERKAANFASRINESIEKVSCIEILDDKELSELDAVLTQMVVNKFKSFSDILYKVAKKTVAIDEVDIETIAVPVEAGKIITMMKIRLDKLAAKVP